MSADLLQELKWRGLIAQSTDEAELAAALKAGITLYCGFDPTAPSLHIGNLVSILVLKRFQLAGHRPIAVVGGATGMVGDPSGRNSERTLNERATVDAWTEKIGAQLGRFLDFDGANKALMVNNYDWTASLGTLDFLRDIGKHFSVNQMLAKESVSARLEGGGISFTEFSYQVLQSLDYLHLYRTFNCTLQIGGSDQWGNITAGMDLIRRVEQGAAHALTTPLIGRADGAKMGKSAGGGTIWLDAEMTSAYAMYQFWFGSDDRDVINFLKAFTFLDQEEILRLEGELTARPAAREAQRALAHEVTALVHGAPAAQAAAAAAEALFGRGDLATLDAQTLASAVAELPQAQVSAPAPLVDLMAATGIVDSKSAARRAIREGGAYVNNLKISDEEFTPEKSDFLAGKYLIVRRGKRELGAVILG